MRRAASIQERGVALIVCLFALLLLTALGLGLIYMADTETEINSNFRDSQRAYFAAEAGLQSVRERLMPTSATAIAPPPVLPATSSPNGVIYVLNYTSSVPKSAIQPWNVGNTYFDTELCHENFPDLLLTNTGANTPCAAAPSGAYYSTLDSTSPFLGADSNLSWRWVRITEKVNSSAVPDTSLSASFYASGSGSTPNTVPICWDGLYELPVPTGWAGCGQPPAGNNSQWLKPVYRLTALAIAPGGSRRMEQMELALDPPMVTNAAVDSQDHVTLNGALTVNGYDYCSCNCTTDSKGNITCTNRTGQTCDTSRYAIYSANSVDNLTGNSEQAVSGQSPAVASYQPWNYNVPAMVAKYAALSSTVNASGPPYNYSCTGSPANCGTQSGQSYGVPPNFPPSPPANPTGPSNMQYQITYVPGDLHMTGNSQGNGILVIDGDLDIDGGLNFYGLILVKGVVKFTGGGSQKVNIYGSVLAGQSSVDDTIVGGSASVYYDLCALTNAPVQQPPSRISFHEVTY